MKNRNIQRVTKPRSGLFYAVVCATVIAIVGVIIFWGIPQASYLAQIQQLREALTTCSNADHGETWEEVTESLRQDTTETMIFFDKKLNKLLEITSNDNAFVALDDGLMKGLTFFDDMTWVHNHPNGDSTFSDADIYTPCAEDFRYRVKEIVVISESYIYRLERKADCWPSQDEAQEYLTGLIFSENAERYVFELPMPDGNTGKVFNDFAIECFAGKFELDYSVTELK